MRATINIAENAGIRHRLYLSGSVTVLAIIAVFFFYFDTAKTTGSIWLNNDTYAHGALVLPISLFLIWRLRCRIIKQQPRVSLWGALAVSGFTIMWVLAKITSVQVIQQISLIGIASAIIWAVMGTRLVAVLAFPLAYLLFAVPFGENLVPYLMNYTATFTTKALQLSNVPVFRDGLYFSIPSGDFEVARACSGIRYLIASVALGTLYAYLYYSSIWKRIAFIGVAAIVPLVANVVRAYLIVLLAYFGDMKIAVGVDHLIYGWLFFGLVMLTMFGIGVYFRDSKPIVHATPAADTVYTVPQDSIFSRPWAFILVGLMSVAITVLGPISMKDVGIVNLDEGYGIKIPLPYLAGEWHGPHREIGSWSPQFIGADREAHAGYNNDKDKVELFIAQYRHQQQGRELVNSENRLYDDVTWRRVREGTNEVQFPDGSRLAVRAVYLNGTDNKRLVWYWYDISGYMTGSDIMAKIKQLLTVFQGGMRGTSLVAMATEYEDVPYQAQKVLQSFIETAYFDIKGCLYRDISPGNSATLCQQMD